MTDNPAFKGFRLAASIAYLLFLLKQFLWPDPPIFTAPIHVFSALALVFMYYPLKSENGGRQKLFNVIDMAMVACCIGIVYHYYSETYRIQSRIEYIDEVLLQDKLVFAVGVLMLLEGVRRIVGWSLLSVIIAFLLYAFFGNYVPGWVGFKSFSFEEMTELITMSTSGIFGVTASTAVNFVFYFIMFGAIFSATGGGKIFIDLALCVTGRLKGGAAKAALVGSALFGTISGSAVANVTSTGVLTIPLMRRTGYTAEQAAATEAIASTGGQLMPPIMGVAAFVMAELLAIPYSRIALAGIIPAVSFYFALFMIIDLRSRKTNTGNIDPADLKFDPIVPRLHLLAGPIALVIALFAGYSAPYSALIGCAASLVAPFLRAHTRYGFHDILAMIRDVAKQTANVSIPLASVGIIMGVAMQSNLAMKFVTKLTVVGGDNLAISLLMIIVGCLIMGMGLPTVAAYIIGSVMFVPAVVGLGVDLLAANFFVMYYCVLSMVTPPVALASYAAAGLAKANTLKTGNMAFVLSFVVFIIPFGFIVDPALLWEGELSQILLAFAGLLLATFSWAVFLIGWLGVKLNILERLVFLACSFTIVLERSTETLWHIAFIVNMLMIVWCLVIRRRRQKTLDAGGETVSEADTVTA